MRLGQGRREIGESGHCTDLEEMKIVVVDYFFKK